jgi:hypothetical protein
MGILLYKLRYEKTLIFSTQVGRCGRNSTDECGKKRGRSVQHFLFDTLTPITPIDRREVVKASSANTEETASFFCPKLSVNKLSNNNFWIVKLGCAKTHHG